MSQHISLWQDKVNFNWCYFHHDELSLSCIDSEKSWLIQPSENGVGRKWNMKVLLSCVHRPGAEEKFHGQIEGPLVKLEMWYRSLDFLTELSEGYENHKIIYLCGRIQLYSKVANYTYSQKYTMTWLKC